MQLYITSVVSFYCTDEQLLSIMESICALVDTVPEHELIGLSCGTELLLKRAQRCVHLCGKILQLLLIIIKYTPVFFNLFAFLLQEKDSCNWYWCFIENSAAGQYCDL